MGALATIKISEISTLLNELTNETLVAVSENNGQGVYTTKKVDLRIFDRIKFYNSFQNFPEIGDTNVIYIAKDTLKIYIWDNDQYLHLKNTEYAIGENTVYFTEKVNISSGGSVIIDWKKGNKQSLTLTEDTTVSFVNPPGPCNLLLRIIQDSTGGWTINLPTLLTPGGSGVTFSTDPNAIDLLMMYFDGSNYIATVLNDVK